ncbi:ribonucleoside-triphosphate reductase, adenosylcobalamin-dependent [Gordonia sp. X0973]|uniref:ribonucleoside-triphosphate reductase, adenosylcobalamin-dependent n=1 Tax=Gordonia sp. X0973 TaxID=2742602 RepID=UPI000F53FCA1|nr:ribonucleoside-triphosphate reductase, adenosylcobalamin-dependent [Gordonia sp. X0973]QKT07901.1 ribonucleoside-triphosphate reductase, adenosylcobalamin-dependent [Gordonia sp. X0973]
MHFSETGRTVYERTYSRPKPDGSKETWPETVERVVDGNIALVEDARLIPGERDELIRMMTDFQIIPAGRHLWASGVKGATHLFNCWVSGWLDDDPAKHFEFTFMRLMEGGGVGANYSRIPDYSNFQQFLSVHVVCDPGHPDYDAMVDAGLLSEEYSSDWDGAFEVEDSREGWAAAVVDLISTYYREDVKNSNRVYDVSNVRAAGSRLKTFGGTASGPAPLAKALRSIAGTMNTHDWLTGLAAMEIDHALAECVVSGGVRRSARMSIMRWDDPDIIDFIKCKQSGISHWSTNISVEVDAEFWERVRGPALDAGLRSALAREVFQLIAEGMRLNGEPGFWDSSLSNVGEPNVVHATNPCAEIVLEDWEPCNLGHVNLAAFVDPKTGTVAWSELLRAHTLMTRFLIRATFAPVTDPLSREVLDRNRRIGVGHLGVASYLAMIGQRYSDAPNTSFDWELRSLAKYVDEAAVDYSHQLRIPVPVKKRTVAPTGTIAKMPGVSEGVHPIFSKYFLRRIRFSTVDPDQVAQVEDYRRRGFRVVDDIYADNTAVVEIPTKDSLVEAVENIGLDSSDVVEGADELTLDQMLSFQEMYQRGWADNAVSYTANFNPSQYSSSEIRRSLLDRGGLLKGATVFPEASMELSPYERLTREEYEAYATSEVADGVDEECGTGGCPIR